MGDILSTVIPVRRGAARARMLRWLALGLMALAVLAPFVPLLLWSFAFRWAFPSLLPSEWSLRPWRYIASPASQVGLALWNSLALGLVVTLLATLIGVPAGRALGLHQFRGKRLVEFLILAPVIVPGIAVVLGIHVLFIRYGLSETFAGVALVHLIPTIPYMTLVMASVFANYDPQFEDQARVLGAGPWRAFWLVTLPAIWPGLAVGALFAFLISWSQYVLTLLIGGGAVITLPLLLFAFAGSGDNAIAAALCLVFVAPGVLLLLLTSRYLSGEPAAVSGFGKL